MEGEKRRETLKREEHARERRANARPQAGMKGVGQERRQEVVAEQIPQDARAGEEGVTSARRPALETGLTDIPPDSPGCKHKVLLDTKTKDNTVPTTAWGRGLTHA